MKKLLCVLTMFLCLLSFNSVLAEGNSPAVDVYVLVFDNDTFYKPPAVVEVYLKANTINCTPEVCPDGDIRVIGEAFDPKGNFLGMRMVTIKKSYLNDEKNWQYDHPKHKDIRGNNAWLWDV